MATKQQQGNRKQRRDQRRGLRLRGDGSERTTKTVPVATRRTKRMLVPSMNSPMLAHAEAAAAPRGLLADMVKQVGRSPAQVGGSPCSPVEAAQTEQESQAPCASLYGGCAPECGAGNRCQAEQQPASPEHAMHEEAASSLAAN